MSFLQIPDAMVAPEWPPSEPLALPTKYELDPFQKHAVLGIHAGDHVFVTAKTGSGKTFVGEYLIARCLAKGQRVFYTTPIKSLSNQKYHDLKKLFPDATVGILTGDIKMCPDAQIVVMTAEILRNLLYKRGTATEGVGLTAAVSLEGVAGVVMDEVHYIQDPDRGHVWEESLILCSSTPGVATIQLVLLSATLPSAASLAGWLANLHQRRTWLLSTTFRIVPLVHGLLDPDGTVTPLLDPQGRWIGDAYTGWLRDRKAVADAAAVHKKAVENRNLTGGPVVSGKVRVEDPVARLLRTVQWLKERGNLPALFFIFSRRECERYAAIMTGSFLDSSDSATAAHIIDFHLSRHKEILQKSPQYHAIRDLLLRGIAFHHSGLQPLLKEIVEIMFTRGYVKLLFATETFSVGLNMPTKTVVFLELEKWSDNHQKRLLRPDEYIQMAGRAGRRGLDTQGLVLYQPMRDPVDPGELRGLLTGALPALQSRMRFHYDFLLKQLLNPTTGTLAEKSYWAQEQKATRIQLGKELAALGEVPKPAHMDIAELVALEEQVAISVNAKRKKAQQALTKWLAEHDYKQMDRLKADYLAYQALVQRRDRLTSQIAEWDASPLLCLDPQEKCLRVWGFVQEGLSPVGLAATEVNEGHCILMPLLAVSGQCADLTGEEIACILAGCIRENGSDEASLSSSGLRPEAIAVLQWMDNQARLCQRTEDVYGVLSPPHFWDLSALWVCVAARWLAGYGLTEIAKEFELFEGNVQRGLLRVANLLEEWGAVATLRQDLATLEKLASLKFLRNEVIVDSLYLRL